MAASVRPHSSGRNYNYMVRIYMDWCSRQVPAVPPFTASVAQVANFLAWVYKERDLGQSAVASFRSAISKVHVGFGGVPIGRDGSIANLVKGIGNANPERKARRPRHKETWELAPVLEALTEYHPPESLSTIDLTVKALSLVALSSISRSSTLNILSRMFEYRPNRVEGGDPQLFIFFLPGRQE